jgi:hypothetical protein
MANALYSQFKEDILSAGYDLSALNLKAVLIDTDDYTFSAAHDDLVDVAAGSRVATSPNLTSKTFTGGVFDAADPVFPTVSGDVSEAVILYVDTGVEATSRLICYIDTFSAGMPVTPIGGNITVQWDASGIFIL